MWIENFYETCWNLNTQQNDGTNVCTFTTWNITRVLPIHDLIFLFQQDLFIYIATYYFTFISYVNLLLPLLKLYTIIIIMHEERCFCSTYYRSMYIYLYKVTLQDFTTTVILWTGIMIWKNIVARSGLPTLH